MKFSCLLLLVSLFSFAQNRADFFSYENSKKKHSYHGLHPQIQRNVFKDFLKQYCELYYHPVNFKTGYEKCLLTYEEDEDLFEAFLKAFERKVIRAEHLKNGEKHFIGKNECYVYRGGVLDGVLEKDQYLRLCEYKSMINGKESSFKNYLVLSTQNESSNLIPITQGRDKVFFTSTMPEFYLWRDDKWRSWFTSIYSAIRTKESIDGVRFDFHRKTYNRRRITLKELKIGDSIHIYSRSRKDEEVFEFDYVKINGKKFYFTPNGYLFSSDFIEATQVKGEYRFAMENIKERGVIKTLEPVDTDEAVRMFGYLPSVVAAAPEGPVASLENEVAVRWFFQYQNEEYPDGELLLEYKDGKPYKFLILYNNFHYNTLKMDKNGCDLEGAKLPFFAYDPSTFMIPIGSEGSSSFFVKLVSENKAVIGYISEKEELKFNKGSYLIRKKGEEEFGDLPLELSAEEKQERRCSEN